MDTGFYNKEGYPDPTPYKALYRGSSHGFRPTVCLAAFPSKKSSEDKSILESFALMSIDHGVIPFVPQLAFSFMEKNDTYEYFCMILMTKCKELWIYGDGDDQYIRHLIKAARTRNLPIRYYGQNDL